MRNIYWLLLSVFTLTATATHAADFNIGFDAYNSGDYATAFVEFSELAEQGNSISQYILAMMFENGFGVAQDYTAAVKWYTLAAEQGVAEAQRELGVLYLNGTIEQDYAAAFKWLNLAAEQAYASAQTALGVMYYEGNGALQDYVMAHMWANIGAANGDINGAGIRDLAAGKMAQDDILNAQEFARECMASNYENCGY